MTGSLTDSQALWQLGETSLFPEGHLPGNHYTRLRHAPIQGITFLLTSPALGAALFGPWRCKRLSAPEIKLTTYLTRSFKMQVSKLIVALTVAAGFASASFAQGTAAPAAQPAPAAKVTAPAPATAEKKVEAPKAAEPVKAEAKAEVVKPASSKSVEKHGKTKGHEHKAEKHAKADGKTEVKPESKPEVKPLALAPAAK